MIKFLSDSILNDINDKDISIPRFSIQETEKAST